MDDLIRNRNAFQQEIDTIKETLSNNVKEKESLLKTLTVFKTESKEKESKYIDKEIVFEKQNKELENIICKIVIAKEHAVISVINDEETLILDKESRSKMFDKQNDPISIEKKIKISLTDYSKLNKIKEDFGKRFVTQKELSAEQAFWLKHSSFSENLLELKLLVNFLRNLLKDLLSYLGYTVGGDDINNIDSLRKHSSYGFCVVLLAVNTSIVSIVVMVRELGLPELQRDIIPGFGDIDLLYHRKFVPCQEWSTVTHPNDMCINKDLSFTSAIDKKTARASIVNCLLEKMWHHALLSPNCRTPKHLDDAHVCK
ncbi:hypothetical protein Tco_0393020 [Tanacetum coccineum]